MPNTDPFQTFRFSHEAMATLNSVDICHDDERYARQAAQAAFQEMDRLVSLLSRFEEGSDIFCFNHAPACIELAVSVETYECLAQAKQIAVLTQGAFDVTVGNLRELWHENSPEGDDLKIVRGMTGIDYLELSTTGYAVTPKVPGLSIDLGGIGKGYIIDKMAEVLEEWELPRALINSGGSSILALDPPVNSDGWSVTCGDTVLDLKQAAVSGSGLEVKGNHIIDPRTGEPVPDSGRTWTLAPTAAIADAMSTAAMIMTDDEKAAFLKVCPMVVFL